MTSKMSTVKKVRYVRQAGSALCRRQTTVKGCAVERLCRVGALVLIAMQVGCASPIAAPFPFSFEKTNVDSFQIVARGTEAYPANTEIGETNRMAWIRSYIVQQKLCSAGFTIVSRKLDLTGMSP